MIEPHYETVQATARLLAVPERDLRRAVEANLIAVWVYGGGKRRRRYLVDVASASEWNATRRRGT